MLSLTKRIQEIFSVNDFYQVLQTNANSDQNEVKKAYLKKCLEYHPDKIRDLTKIEAAKTKFQLISRVYEILSDEKTRSDYDSFRGSPNCLFTDLCIDADESSHQRDIVPLLYFSQDHESHYYECRCSGKFILSKDFINKDNQSSFGAFIIDCDSCSNSIKLIMD